MTECDPVETKEKKGKESKGKERKGGKEREKKEKKRIKDPLIVTTVNPNKFSPASLRPGGSARVTAS